MVEMTNMIYLTAVSHSMYNGHVINREGGVQLNGSTYHNT